MDQKSQENFVREELEGKMALISNLCRYFGKKLKSGPKHIWEPDGLFIYTNYEEIPAIVIVFHNWELVCSNLLENYFVPGPWWGIIEGMKDKIQLAKKLAEINIIERFTDTLTK
jgi:hypothetical protein